MEFSGRVAVVTGAAVGIGRATVMQFLKEGAKVAALDVDAEKLTALQEELTQYADNLFCGVCDVSNAQEDTRVIDQAAEKFGGIDGEQCRFVALQRQVPGDPPGHLAEIPGY